MAKKASAPSERKHLQSSQDRKVTPVAWYQDLRQRWVPTVFNSFSLPPVLSCPGRTGPCVAGCYAIKLAAMPHVGEAWQTNYDILLEAEARGGEDAIYELLSPLLDQYRKELIQKKVKPGKDWVYRMHESGDFYSLAYARAWARVYRENPDIHFMVFTRSFWPDCDVIPILVGIPNVGLYISADAGNNAKAHEVADRYNLRIATYAKDKAEAMELYQRENTLLIVCPENSGLLPLTRADKDRPGNGKGACIVCRACIRGKTDIVFTEQKGKGSQPALFKNLAVTNRPARFCANRACGKSIDHLHANRKYCGDDCRFAENGQYGGSGRPRLPGIELPHLFDVPMPKGKPKASYTDEELLEHLRMLTRALQKRPAETDLFVWRMQHDDTGPTTGPYKRFGGLANARHQAGVENILAELADD